MADQNELSVDDKLNLILDQQEAIKERLAAVDRRLNQGAEEFALQRADWSIAMNFMRELALERGRSDLAAQVDRLLEERKVPGHANGAFHDEKTNPGG